MIKTPHPSEQDHIIYLPTTWKIVLFILLFSLGAVALIGAGYYLINDNKSDRVVSLMSVAQTAIGASIAIIIVMFSEKNISIDRLNKKTDDFLNNHLKSALERIDIDGIQVVKVQTDSNKRKDIYGINYKFLLKDQTISMWVGLNVRRLGVIYFINNKDQKDISYFKEIFFYTFKGAEDMGYKVNFECATINGENIISIWSTVMTEQSIINQPSEQLFWAQDIAMMTQSFIRTAIRHNIDTQTQCLPCPI